jgi:hypothetical protein
MRTRHLKRFTELEAERDDIGRQLAALAKQATQETGGDPALLDAIPPLGDVLGQVPDKIKQKLFDAFDVQALYSKTQNQVTFWATITPPPPPPWPRSTPPAKPPTSPPCSPPTPDKITFQTWHATLEQPKPHDHQPSRAQMAIATPCR